MGLSSQFSDPNQRGKFPFLRVLAPMTFHCQLCCYALQISWGLEHETVEKIKGKVGFSLFLSVKSSFSHIWTKMRVLLQELSLNPTATSGVSYCSVFRLETTQGKKKKTVNLLLIWCYFELHSSPTWLLLFTFQCSLIATICILSRFHNCIQWERKDRMHLFNLITHPNTLRIEYDLSFCKIKFIF